MAAASYRGKEKIDLGARTRALPNDQEDAALDRAVAAMADLGAATPRSIACVAISAWIMARTSMASRGRLNADLLFDLGDARLRGFVEAALPAIGGTLAHIPGDVPLFGLGKDQIIDVIVAGIRGAQDAAVAANESLGFPFSDEIPF